MTNCTFRKVLLSNAKDIYIQNTKVVLYCTTHYCLITNKECPKKDEISFDETQKIKRKNELEEIIKNQPKLTWK